MWKIFTYPTTATSSQISRCSIIVFLSSVFLLLLAKNNQNYSAPFLPPRNSSTASLQSFGVQLSKNGSSHRLASYSSKRHCLLQNLHRRHSLLRSNIRSISHSIHLKRQFFPHSARAITTSAPQSSQEFVVADDKVAEKFRFEKVYEQFIDECKSKAVLYKHKKLVLK